jgi:transcription elongation factor GreB
MARSVVGTKSVRRPARHAGQKNYVTPEGAARLKAELKQLTSVERPKVVEVVSWAASNGDRSENGDYLYGKKRLREIDRRIRFLIKRLDIAEVVDPAQQTNREQVFFGATVTYVDEEDTERTVRIVGIDEARSEHKEITWITPVARALLSKHVGDVAFIRSPAGEMEIEVLNIAYEDS